MLIHQRRTTRTTVAILCVAAGLGLAGCGTEGPETGTGVEDVTEGEVLESSPPPANDPTARDTFIGNYDQGFYDDRQTYVGQEVVLSAEVNDILGDDGLVIAGAAGTTVDPLLVLYDMDRVDVQDGQVVRVTGTVQDDFDPAMLGPQARESLDDDLVQEFEQQPSIEATDLTLFSGD